MFQKNKRDHNKRFLNQNFKKRLEAQRGYKRNARTLPQTDWGVFLSKAGLGSWWSRLVTAAVFFALIYAVFIPNVFFVKHINVTGGADQAAVQNTINAFLEKKLPWPQKNLLLLSKNNLAAFLLKYNSKILKVDKISKRLPNTLNVTVTPRLDEFLLQMPLSFYGVSNDGVATAQLFADASGTLPSGLVLIKLNTETPLALGAPALPSSTVIFLRGLRQNIPAVVKSELDFYQMADLQAPEVSAYLKNGVRVMFTLGGEVGNALNRLQVLLSQMQDSDKAKLFYVDMRSIDKAYVCFKATPCVKDVNYSNMGATGTPVNLNN